MFKRKKMAAWPEHNNNKDYSNDEENHIPRTLLDARNAMIKSDMLRDAFGDEVMAHYSRAAEVEIEEFNQVVTDWEIARGFERA